MTKSIKIIGLIVLFICGNTIVFGQGLNLFETPAQTKKPAATPSESSNLNQIDATGKKQGKWEKKYPDGKIAYTAFFLNDNPINLLVRYYPSGKIKAKIKYPAKGGSGFAELYDENEKIMAKGIYLSNNQRDSIWSFFDSNGILTSKEQFKNGVKVGTSFTYFTNGKIAEEINWINDKKEGRWLQYFENGAIKLQSQYKNNVIHGRYAYFFPSGKVEISGEYFEGLEDGKWTFYNEAGKVTDEVEFIKGQPKDPKAFEERQKRMFEELEEDKDNLLDPEKYKNNPDALMKN